MGEIQSRKILEKLYAHGFADSGHKSLIEIIKMSNAHVLHLNIIFKPHEEVLKKPFLSKKGGHLEKKRTL